MIQRNYRCRRGEIDLVMRDGELLVFVEVRYRNRDDFGGGAASVDARKRLKLVRAAHTYCQHKGVPAHVSCRFDVVALGPGEREVEWYADAFEVEY